MKSQKKIVRVISFKGFGFFFVLLMAFCALLYFGHPYIRSIFEGNPEKETKSFEGEFSVHFIELGNKYAGDAVYIKAGENDILIDAGSRKNSADDIIEYMNDYITDNKLEYVIATHAHQDHIAAFVGLSDSPGIFDQYECGTIIDFPQTNSESEIVKDYYELRDLEVEQGAKHYNALECYNNQNGASRSYELGTNIKMSILYNYYYDHKTSEENNYSVCLLFEVGSKYFLFTGDLEKEGEERLVEYNDIPEVELFKAGHHGSKTSSSNELLSVIKPKIICVCCCAGTDEYTNNKNNQFPSQDFISRVSKYTDRVYVTSLISDNEDGFTSYNGDIVVSYNDGVINVICSNNDIILKDTEWFKKNRVWA